VQLRLLVLVLALGCDDTPGGPDFSGVGFDFSQGGDLYDMEIANVFCTQTCQSPQACCLTQDPFGNWQAMCATSCPDGGVFTQCTGPSDCTQQTPDCCFTVALSGDMDGSIMSSGGGAMCTSDCPGGLNNGNSSFQTKLCHQTSDCTGYTGDFGMGSEPFDGCCTSPRAPGVHFCSPSRLSGLGGLTC
jgi:hypothetical protein